MSPKKVSKTKWSDFSPAEQARMAKKQKAVYMEKLNNDPLVKKAKERLQLLINADRDPSNLEMKIAVRLAYPAWPGKLLKRQLTYCWKLRREVKGKGKQIKTIREPKELESNETKEFNNFMRKRNKK